MGTTEQTKAATNANTAVAVEKTPEQRRYEIVQKLTDSMAPEQRDDIMRKTWLTLENKTLTVKDENGKNVKVWYTPAQALAYVLACTDLNLNPIMNHVIMLEDQFYITLQGHLQNAHSTGQLVGLETTLLKSETVKAAVTKWVPQATGKDKPQTVETEVMQYRYKCTIRKRMGSDIAEFSAEGVADETNVSGKASQLKLEQMAEARAMRRCLSRAFPVWLSNYEDVQEEQVRMDVATQVEQKVAEIAKDELAEKIANASDMEALAALKDEVRKSGKNEYVSMYAKRVGELNNPNRAKDPEPTNEQATEEPKEAEVTETENVGPEQN